MDGSSFERIGTALTAGDGLIQDEYAYHAAGDEGELR